MDQVNLEKLDDIRKKGLRPQVVGCFIHDKKVLFVFKKKYDLWQIPQGGIDNKENLKDALNREMSEELGTDFASNIGDEYEIIGEDEMYFPQHVQGARELLTDDGSAVLMLGKYYYFVVSEVKKSKLDIEATEFDDYKWVSYDEAQDLIDKIYQPGKRRITIESVNQLQNKGYL